MRIFMCAAVIALTLLLSSCAAQGMENAVTTPAPAPGSEATQQPTPQPTTEPTESPEPKPTGTPGPTREPMPITVEGKTLSTDARTLQGKIMLPLLETMERLAYKARVNELRENDATRRVHTFTKAGEEIAVSYLIDDNTVSDVSFVRGKLIVPVDRLLLFEDEIVYAPANFFEEATGVAVSGENGQITVSVTQHETMEKPAT